MRKTYEYEILVNGRVVWHGLDPGNKFDEIRRKKPEEKDWYKVEAWRGCFNCLKKNLIIKKPAARYLAL